MMTGIGLFQMFCLPALFGVFILSGYIYLRQEKNWLTNVVHGFIKITLGAVCALVGYGIAASIFPAGSETASFKLSQPAIVVTAAGILLGLLPATLGMMEILRAIRRQSQGDERFIPFRLKHVEPPEPPRKTDRAKPRKKQPRPHK